jgi:Fur family zinc uptake transcriptional regulator/Fur family ferric uptake transcriptional regulator
MESAQSAALLKQLKLKVTPRRQEIMNCLGREASYLSADEVWNRIKPRLGSIGLPTVYRILDELAEAGVVTRIFLPDRKQYYFLCSNQEHHHHFVCEACRKVEDVGQCGLDGVTRDFARRSGGRVTSHIIQINGICGSCCQGPAEASQ